MKKRMQNELGVLAAILFLILAMTGCQKRSDSGAGNNSAATSAKAEQVKKVSFTLDQTGKPFGNEEIAIVPIEGDKVLTSDEKRLGLGKTDAQGHATIEFRAPPQYSEFVLIWRTQGTYMMLRHGNEALTFKCASQTCDLGKVTFEVFEFSGSSR